MQMFVDVILPLALANTYTYAVPEEMRADVRIGARVIVSIKAKYYTGLVHKVHFTPPEGFEVKEVVSLLDSQSVVRPTQIKLWQWVADYYQCTLGEVMKAALPSGLKLESETKITAVCDFVADAPLKDKEQRVLDFLGDGSCSISDLNKELEMKNALPLVRRLMDMGAVEISESIEAKYKPKMEAYVALSPDYRREDNLRALMDSLQKYPKQMQTLLAYLKLSSFFKEAEPKLVLKSDLMKDAPSVSALGTLVKNGVLEVKKCEVGRLQSYVGKVLPLSPLSAVQNEAYQSILQQFSEKRTVLLHGVTSSGKTEIYLHLIQKMIGEGKQSLFLLPEIALTTQITNRLRKVLGDSLLVYHSKFSDAERVEVWKRLLDEHSGVKVVLGVRSSIFLPFQNLGLVIVDEEHETSYKQFDPAPRYHAGNAAVVLASMMDAKVLLGSATPSVESYSNAQKGKYGFVELMQRYEGIEMPEILVADIKEARRKKELVKHFTPLLLTQMQKALGRKEQVILFQNRRGYSPYVECRSCSATPRCVNCDISLSYHKNTNQLTCHYCGYSIPMPMVCPACGNPTLSPVGLGTEQIEDEVAELFPDARVARLDLDVAKTRKGYEHIISSFEQGEIDVLVGTQMISKGLDFERVRLVGVMNADSSLNFPDFRSRERSFQMFSQVAGRAGRKNNRGLVVIQTSSPDDLTIGMVQRNAYIEMYDKEMRDRAEFHYPPYYRLVNIYLKSKDAKVANQAASCLAQGMRAVFDNRVLGPDLPIVPRIQLYYIRKIMLKVESSASYDRAKSLLRELTVELLSQPAFRGVLVNVDVDPM